MEEKNKYCQKSAIFGIRDIHGNWPFCLICHSTMNEDRVYLIWGFELHLIRYISEYIHEFTVQGERRSDVYS